jgi:hypothetical protein
VERRLTANPNGDLEILVGTAHENQDALVEAIQALLVSDLVIPSGGDVTAGAQAFVPVLASVRGRP